MFVDTRLHISVTPVLEYRLPDAGLEIRNQLLGDAGGDGEEAIHSIRACLRCGGSGGGGQPSMSHENDHRHGELWELSSLVCTHAKEHLEKLSATWKQELRLLHGDVKLATRRGSERLRLASEVRDRYAARAPRLVQDEYHIEVGRIRADLEAALESLRARPLPTHPRPPALTSASHRLQEAFASSYGSVPTTSLLRAKEAFESELARIQEDIARDFGRFATRLLGVDAA